MCSLSVCACAGVLEASASTAARLQAAGRSDAAAGLLDARSHAEAARRGRAWQECLPAAEVQQALAHLGTLLCESAAAEATAPEVRLRAARAAALRPCANLGCPNLAAGGCRSANRKCSRCHQSRFCGDACFRQAWRQGHRAACKLLQEQAASA